MRIIAGISGGITIQVPDKVTRPTTDRVREALFSSLGSLVDGARVLDLYSGSGALAIEALSRGAAEAVMVEQCRKACGVIKKNLEKTSLQDFATVQNRRVESFLKSCVEIDAFDLIFADPPYGKDEKTQKAIRQLVEAPQLYQSLKPEGVFILENYSKASEVIVEPWVLANSRSYGESRISFYSK